MNLFLIITLSLDFSLFLFLLFYPTFIKLWEALLMAGLACLIPVIYIETHFYTPLFPITLYVCLFLFLHQKIKNPFVTTFFFLLFCSAASLSYTLTLDWVWLFDDWLLRSIICLLHFILVAIFCLVIRFLDQKFNWHNLLVRYKKKHLFYTFLLLFLFAVINTIRYLSTSPTTYMYNIWGIFVLLFSANVVIIAVLIVTEENKKASFLKTIQKLNEENEIQQFTNEFMHDYRSTLLSLILYIQQNQNDQALQLLNDYINYTDHMKKADLPAALKRITLPSVQSVIAHKLMTMQEKGIFVQLNISEFINILYIEEIDFIRVLSILLNNAIDASSQVEHPCIEISITENHLMVKNSTTSQHKMQNIQELLKKGATTKPGHSGQGLYILTKILGQYTQTSLQIENHDNRFIVNIKFG